jgi:hypothetical protein
MIAFVVQIAIRLARYLQLRGRNDFIRSISSTVPVNKLVTDNRVDERQFTEIQRDFLDPAEFYDALTTRKLSFFTGVPDSLLKDFCAYVTEHTPEHRHIITANEGNAVAVAAGVQLK